MFGTLRIRNVIATAEGGCCNDEIFEVEAESPHVVAEFSSALPKHKAIDG